MESALNDGEFLIFAFFAFHLVDKSVFSGNSL